MIETAKARELMEKTLMKRRVNGVLSTPHNEMHAINVARYGRILAEKIAIKEGFNIQKIIHIADLAEVAGYLHDIARLPKEYIPHPIESARWVAYASGYLREPMLFWVVQPEHALKLSKDELATVTFAIIQHEKPLYDVIRACGFGFKTDERAIVTVCIKIADSLFERSGFRAIEKRCYFVGNERLHYGDFQFLKENELTREKPYLWAVLGETIVRLYSRNHLRGYPKWLEGTAARLHAIQYRFYSNLIRMVAPSVPADELVIAQLLARIQFPGIDDKLLYKVKNERHITSAYWNNYPQIKEAIRASEMDNQKILLRLIEKISCSNSIEDAYNLWKKAVHLNYFAHGVVEYNEGACDYLDSTADDYTPYR
ncbi:MAG: HD domain-containing protein [Candidatus Micrarchaeia archaeon]